MILNEKTQYSITENKYTNKNVLRQKVKIILLVQLF